jgi:hypothetical protein
MNRPTLSIHRLLGAMAIPLLGCDDVPTLTFPGEDASPNLADVGADSFAAPDALAPIEAGCPVHPPPGASACCGSVPCNGDCDAHCLECQSKCAPLTQVCCAKTNATCHAPTFVCN